MENVGPVLVHLDAVDFLGVDVTGDVVALFDDLNALPPLGGFVGKGGAEEAGTDY